MDTSIPDIAKPLSFNSTNKLNTQYSNTIFHKQNVPHKPVLMLGSH